MALAIFTLYIDRIDGRGRYPRRHSGAVAALEVGGGAARARKREAHVGEGH